ncbi:MAG: ATP--guanido phosphotransferase [Chitinivibrionales bacterium]|nr:ATP--guanido phosphotransferase [Chitinivibrionales bacterium]MBD3397414.1 ATP--guanido phosphotransferase [Chitinivibrionales bacterium]
MMIARREANEFPHWLEAAGPENDIVVSTRVRLARCLSDHVFPARSSLLQRREAFDEVASALEGVGGDRRFRVLNFIACDPLDQELLLENRVASPDLLAAEGDRGVAVREGSRLSVMINEEDHVRLQCMDAGLQARKSWEAVSGVDDELGTRLRFAFDGRKGFLTCCPTNSGTGLRISFLMHLPGLILTKAIDPVLQGASQMGLSTRGFFGENSSVVGSFFQLSNHATMGASEEQFLSATAETIARVIECERGARARLLGEARAELTDKVCRAYGLLMYARSLTMEEFLNLASAVRLGAECGIFEKVSVATLNRLMVRCMPAHLQAYLRRRLDKGACGPYRAEVVQEMLSAS